MTGINTNQQNNMVFVSYASEDYGAAEKLCEELKNVGLSLWIDKRSLIAGQNWKIAIKNAIEKSRYFIPIFSLTSIKKRGYVQKEFKYAIEVLDEFPESEIFIIPVRLDNCKIPYEKLNDIQYVDLFPSWQEGIRRIIQAMKIPSSVSDIITDVSEEEIDSYVNVITMSPNPDAKQTAFNYLEKLAKSTCIWKHDKIWSLMEKEILVSAPTQFFKNATSIIKWMLVNSEKVSTIDKNYTVNKVKEHYLSKIKEILGSIESIWDSYDRTIANNILKYITDPTERCRVWWEAWKKCADGIEDTNQYTKLTQLVSSELENSKNECKDSIRIEKLSLIDNSQSQSPHLSERAKHLQI